MLKKEFQRRQGNSSHDINPATHSSLRIFEYFDAEREAQREEFLKREKENGKTPEAALSREPLTKKRKKSKSRPMTFEEQLDLTYFWLEETFPHLFSADNYVPLDHNLLQDLKNDYKNNHIKKGYPEGLVIKAALSRYKQSFGYLESLREGAYRFNISDECCGMVTHEEEEAARKILDTL